MPPHVPWDNLAMEQRSNLKTLRGRDVVYKPTVKGRKIVIWTNKMYKTEVYSQLRNKTCYKKLHSFFL